MYRNMPAASMPHTARRSTVVERVVRLGPVALVLLCIVAAGCLIRATWVEGAAQDFPPVAPQTFAHWRDDGHDWLLKAEPGHSRLVIYDAADGRPLRNLPVSGVRGIVLKGGQLYVLGATTSSVRVLSLPSLALRRAP